MDDDQEAKANGHGRHCQARAAAKKAATSSVPLGIAVRAVERVVSRGIDLALDR
jgi:hypothetical protein